MNLTIIREFYLFKKVCRKPPYRFQTYRLYTKIFLLFKVDCKELIKPAVLTELANELHTLSDFLGEDHDLAVLRNMILTAPTYSDGVSEALLIVQIIDQERLMLEENALTLAGRLLSVTPEKFVQQMEIYWRAWKSENIN